MPERHRGWHERGYLPHFDAADTAQAITYRLADALPRHVQHDRRRAQSVLDRGRGNCILQRPEVAREVIDAWRYFDGIRYRLHAWVVMPNHVHVVATILAGHALSRTVHSWKSFTAHRIRARTRQRGRIWHPDYWDRFIRDDEHFRTAVEYVEYNPVLAGLARRPEQWLFSSAYHGAGAA
ncbi:transposase [bacterium]|nr:transposase [bacterium]